MARGDALSLHVADMDMGDEVRSSRSLSGGERFLVSLGLALALSGLEGRQGACDVLLIDEGFGSLDGASLDMAVAALETLHGFGRKVGVVTHVAAMVERIPTGSGSPSGAAGVARSRCSPHVRWPEDRRPVRLGYAGAGH